MTEEDIKKEVEFNKASEKVKADISVDKSVTDEAITNPTRDVAAFSGGSLSREGVYKVHYSPLGGGVIKSVGEVYQVMKRGREYHGCGEE